MAVSELVRYEGRLNDDESGARKALMEKFGVSTLFTDAASNGYEISTGDWEDYLVELDMPKTKLQLVTHDADDGIREIDLEELDMVSGGLEEVAAGFAAVWTNAVVAAEAAVNVLVYANAVAVTLVAVTGAAVAVIVAVVA